MNASTLKQKSTVWLFFSKLPDGKKISCNLCKLQLTNCGGTSNLLRHLSSKHPTESNSLQDGQTPSKRPRLQQPSIDESCVTTRKYPADSQRQKMLTEKLMKMIVRDMQPFSIVDDAGFREFIAALDPAYTIPSRTTLTRRRLKEMYDLKVAQLRDELSAVEHISLTTDGWTSRQTMSYLTVTCHYITDDWILKSAVLNTVHMKTDHTSENLSDEVTKICTQWGINTKIAAVVTDGAANMVAAVRLLGYRHLPCFAHMLHLVVKSALDEPPFSTARDKTKAIVSYFHHSTKATEHLCVAQEELDLEPRRLVMDVCTRWNSTYQMIVRYLEQHEAVTKTLCYAGRPSMCLEETDVTCLRMSADLLKLFEDVTKEFSADKYVSLSKVILLLRALKTNISSKAETSILAEKLFNNLKKRFPATEPFFPIAAATILDPRFKKLAFAVKENANSAVTKLMSEMPPPADIDLQDDTVVRAENSQSDLLWGHFDTLVDTASSNRPQTVTCEIESRRYFESKPLNRLQDPLGYWKENEKLFPQLARLAKKYLCTPASSVPSERLFSAAGELISSRRSRLLPQHVDMLLFLNNNL